MGNTVKTVKVVVAGDSSGAQGALDKLSAKSQSAATTIKGHLSGMFSTLNQSGMFGGLVSQVSELAASFDGLALKGKSTSEKLAGIGVAGAGVGAALTMAAQGDIQAQKQLAQAFTDTGNNIADYKDQIDKAITTGAKYGSNAKDVQRALQTLVQASHDPAEALKRLSLVENIAAAKHEDLATASEMVAKVMAGKGTRAMAEFGLQSQMATASLTSLQSAQKSGKTATEALAKAQANLASLEAADHAKKSLTIADQQKLKAAHDAVAKAQDNAAYQTKHLTEITDAFNNPVKAAQGNLDALAKVTKGQAAAASDTFKGKLEALRAEVENHVAEIGQKYGPALTAAGAGLTVVASASKAASSVMSMLRGGTEAAAAAQDVLTASQTAGGVAADGLAAGETAADAAGMPLILTIGLIVLAVAAVIAIIYELVTHWKEVFGAIKAVVSDVIDFIKKHWELIVEILLAPIAPVLAIFLRFHDQIIGFFAAVVHFIAGVPGSIVSFFTGLPDKIMGALTGLLDKMVSFGENIIHSIVSGVEHMGSAIWDSIKKHIPGSGVIGGALSAIGLAEGGIVTKPTLAMIGEAGYPEAVIPLKGGATVKGFNDAVQGLGSVGGGGQAQQINTGHSFQVEQNIYLPTGTPQDFADETTWRLGRLVA